MSRPKGSKNSAPDEGAVKDIYMLIKFVSALMANPNIYPKHGDSAVIAMALRMIREMEK